MLEVLYESTMQNLILSYSSGKLHPEYPQERYPCSQPELYTITSVFDIRIINQIYAVYTRIGLASCGRSSQSSLGYVYYTHYLHVIIRTSTSFSTKYSVRETSKQKLRVCKLYVRPRQNEHISIQNTRRYYLSALLTCPCVSWASTTGQIQKGCWASIA